MSTREPQRGFQEKVCRHLLIARDAIIYGLVMPLLYDTSTYKLQIHLKQTVEQSQSGIDTLQTDVTKTK